MIHSAAAIQIPRIIISEDNDIDFVVPSMRIDGDDSEDDDDESVAYYDDEIDDESSAVPTTPMRRYLRSDNVR